MIKKIKFIWKCIFVLLILIAGAFLFSEKVHRIDMIDNIKNRLIGQVEEVIDSNDEIIDIDINENNELHLQQESDVETFTLSYEDNQENSISAYEMEEIPGTELSLINKYGVTVDPSGNNSSGKFDKTGNLTYNAGIIKKIVGDSGFHNRLPYNSYVCGYCNNILAQYIPDAYAKITTTFGNTGIVNLIGYDVEEKFTDVKPYPCLKTLYSVQKPGTTMVRIEYYVNYNISAQTRRCSTCGRNAMISSNYSWYRYIDSMEIIVNSMYKLEYKTDDLRVTNMPNNEEKSIAATTCDFEISLVEPKLEGYIFKGWSNEQDNYKADYLSGGTVTLDWEEGLGSQDKPVTFTLYPVWEKIEDYEEKYKVEYYYDNVIDRSKTEILNLVTEEIINSKKESGQKENYIYEKVEKEGNTVKLYYVSKGAEKPTQPTRLYTITVKNENEGHTYNSYQVFKGDFAYDEDGNPVLSNIAWNSEFEKIAEEGKTYGDKLIEKLKDPNENVYASLFTDCETALDIAEILAGKENDGAEIREFTKVTGKFILENNIKITKGVSEQTTETIDGEELKTYKITELEAGYYIVIDAKANVENDAYSRYLIDVVQDVTMEPKSSLPTLSKIVKTNNVDGNEKVNTALHIENGTYDIEFEIVTTIGADIEAYGSEYKYEVVDILAKGFEYDRESVKVYVGENKIEYAKENYILSDIFITEDNYETYKEYFEEGAIESEQYGKTIVLINFKDIPGKVTKGELLEGQKIIIDYNAKLNNECEVGKIANVNKAYLKYSNNPYEISNTGKTKTETTLTYSIELNIEKIAEKKEEIEETKYLSGAIFEIYDGPERIKNEGGLIPVENSNRKLIGTVEIGEEGKEIYNSLGAGTYYIKEVKAPDGYNMLKEEIEMEVLATYDGFGINWEVEDKSNNRLVLITKEILENTTPYIKLQVENTRGIQLPTTGGIGTVIFTVVGIGIMAIAVIGLKTNKK